MHNILHEKLENIQQIKSEHSVTFFCKSQHISKKKKKN